MDTSESNKKVNLEELNKEDLLKKCRSLLLIAQKAKQTKDALQEENNALKLKMKHQIPSNDSATQEIIENLTEQKLNLVTTIEDLKMKNSKLSKFEEELRVALDRASELDSENVSYKRQNARLTDENEQLITDMDALEKQIIKQREQLLALEQNNKVGELQNMLSISLAEVKKLQTEHRVSEEKLNSKIQATESEVSLLQNSNKILKEKVKFYHSKIVKVAGDAKAIKEEKNNILRIFKGYTSQVKEWKNQLNTAEIKLVTYINDIEAQKAVILNENEAFKLKISEMDETIAKLNSEIANYQSMERQLAQKSSEEILKLIKENKENSELIEHLQTKVQAIELVGKFNIETQTDETHSTSYNEQYMNLQRDNADVLQEMNEMNQALKERSDSISKLEAHCEEMKKKLQIYEAQANRNVDSISDKETLIHNLQQQIKQLANNSNKVEGQNSEEVEALRLEVQQLKEQLNESAECETMSTSTISRMEDMNRLKDLDSSWEERYGKLRNLALKLKAKIRELTASLSNEQNEKDGVQKALANANKGIQSLQAKIDELQDELETSKLNSSEYLKKLNSIAQDISKDKQNLSSNEEVIAQLRLEIADLKKDKLGTETWKKQVGSKVQTLRKELEANNLIKKDYENKLAKISTELEGQKEALTIEAEGHKQTKLLLSQLNNECKKNSVLNLEMQDYERSVKELSLKLETKDEEISKLKSQIEAHKTTINTLREQNKLLEERVRDEATDLTAASTEIQAIKKKLASSEETIFLTENKLQSVVELLEKTRAENEELSTEMSKIIAENQKTGSSLRSERDNMRNQLMGLQQNLREVQDTLRLREDELGLMRNEYDGYKVRAQSVLRQNQSRDVGFEEKMQEEAATFKAQNVALNREMSEIREKMDELHLINGSLTSEKEELLQRCRDIQNEVEELKEKYTELTNKHQRVVNEHAETVRSLKVHADTLSQCYRQQISEQEVRHNREIIELQSKLEKSPSPTSINENLPLPSIMTREEGEGSESIDSATITNHTYPVPLERLLGNDADQEVTYVKRQLSEYDVKVSYLTALLSDTEQDLAKHVQMNKLLKEEIRRQQRSVEREKHAENLEYLKNIVFKFITLGGGDERAQLVPVLNTILKLSPEETQKLSEVAKGEPGLRGWTNYLAGWNNNSPAKN